jgi:uncharacterized protein (UPF0218 family)
MRVLPDDLRETLKKPIGRLVDEKELLKLLQHEKYIVSVGDLVTFTLLKNKIEPSLCIIDYILEREPYSPEMKQRIQAFGLPHIKVKNPAGTITDELWNAIESSYQNLEKGPICIEIDGEEDLAALVAIYTAPRDVTVIYGLPNRGVVVVKDPETHKKIVKDILDKM